MDFTPKSGKIYCQSGKSINRSDRQWTRKWWNIDDHHGSFCTHCLTMERATAFTRIKAIYSHGLCQNALPQCTDFRILPVLSQNASFSRLFSLCFFAENKNALVHAHIPGNKAFNWFGVLHRKSIWTRQFHRIVNQSSTLFLLNTFSFCLHPFDTTTFIHPMNELSVFLFLLWLIVMFFASGCLALHFNNFRHQNRSNLLYFTIIIDQMPILVRLFLLFHSNFWEACKKE